MIKLRPLEEKDWSGMYEWMTDPDIASAFIFDHKSITMESTKRFIENSRYDDKNQHFAVIDDINDEYLGTISLKNIDTYNRNAEYAISMRSEAHGKGVAKVATKVILEKALFDMDLNRVYLYVATDNVRANKFYRKLRFVFEGTFKQHIIRQGCFKDINWYAITKEDFCFMKFE